MALYFAYGSNLNINRMLKRCPTAQPIGVGTLEGYILVFQNNNKGKIVANLMKENASEVPGVVYHMSDNDLQKLDRYEGHPYVYRRTTVPIDTEGNPELFCTTYIMDQTYTSFDYLSIQGIKIRDFHKKQRYFGKPKNDYLNHIIYGYNYYDLNSDYLLNALEIQ